MLADLRVQRLPPARGAGARRPARLPQRRPAGPAGARRGLPAGPVDPGVPPFAIAVVVGAATVAVVWWILPAAGLVLLVCPAAGGHGGALAHRAAGPTERGPPGPRPRRADARPWSTSSRAPPDLVVFGAARAQVDRITATRRRADRGRPGRRPAPPGSGLGLTTLLAGLAMWGGLCVGIPAVHTGQPGRRATWRSSSSIPLAAFELVAGLPVATQALQRARRAAARRLRRDRRPAAGGGAAHPAACPLPPVAFSGRAASGPATPAPTARPSTASTSTSGPGSAWPSSGRAGPASRPWPPSCCASSRTRLGHPGGDRARPPGRRRRPSARRAGRPGRPPLRHHPRREPAHRAQGRHRRRAPRRPRPRRAGRLGGRTAQRHPDRGRRPVGTACRAGSASASPSPGPCWPTSPSSCSTSPPSTSIRWRPTPSAPTSSA